MQVLKIELEGVTTSFRYPHFMVGRQPSYAMPPPATIYGHIASALGDYPERKEVRFAYSFSYAGKGDDLESIHMAEVKPGWIDKKAGIPRNLEAVINPLPREIFLAPRLSLYLDVPNLEAWHKAFREPRYPVLLGRSQDLASYSTVKLVDLVERETGYLEGTLLTTEFRKRTNAGVFINMPRYINPENRRQVEWEMYLVVESKLRVSRDEADRTKANAVYFPPENETVWVDPQSPEWRELQRAVIWHNFTGD